MNPYNQGFCTNINHICGDFTPSLLHESSDVLSEEEYKRLFYIEESAPNIVANSCPSMNSASNLESCRSSSQSITPSHMSLGFWNDDSDSAKVVPMSSSSICSHEHGGDLRHPSYCSGSGSGNGGDYNGFHGAVVAGTVVGISDNGDSSGTSSSSPASSFVSVPSFTVSSSLTNPIVIGQIISTDQNVVPGGSAASSLSSTGLSMRNIDVEQ